jgi:hypothetical protein
LGPPSESGHSRCDTDRRLREFIARNRMTRIDVDRSFEIAAAKRNDRRGAPAAGSHCAHRTRHPHTPMRDLANRVGRIRGNNQTLSAEVIGRYWGESLRSPRQGGGLRAFFWDPALRRPSLRGPARRPHSDYRPSLYRDTGDCESSVDFEYRPSLKPRFSEPSETRQSGRQWFACLRRR